MLLALSCSLHEAQPSGSETSEDLTATEPRPEWQCSSKRMSKSKSGSCELRLGKRRTSIPCLSAEFGAPLPPRHERLQGPVELLDSENVHGCEPFTCAVKGCVVVVRRGGCGFSDKATVADEAGAAAILVVNSDEELMPMGAAPSMANLSLVALMIRASDGVELVSQGRQEKHQLHMTISTLSDPTLTPAKRLSWPQVSNGSHMHPLSIIL